MLLFTDPLHHPEADDLRLLNLMDLDEPDPVTAEQRNTFAALHISRSLAEQITGDRSIVELQRSIDNGAKPFQQSMDLPSARIQVTRRAVVKEITAHNVVGFLEGQDPR